MPHASDTTSARRMQMCLAARNFSCVVCGTRRGPTGVEDTVTFATAAGTVRTSQKALCTTWYRAVCQRVCANVSSYIPSPWCLRMAKMWQHGNSIRLLKEQEHTQHVVISPDTWPSSTHTASVLCSSVRTSPAG